MKKMMNKTKLLVSIILITFVIVFVSVFIYRRYFYRPTTNLSVGSYPIMSLAELAKYDGSTDNMPIYIGLNGYVYDVTPGKNFYDINGSYHYLAGKDSSAELNLIGGDIIARKYKIIATLAQ